MDPLSLIALAANFIPPPWGPLVASIIKVAPLIEQQGMAAIEAVNQADPNLLQHLQDAADQAFGGDLSLAARAIFAPAQLSDAEKQALGPAYHGGPKS